MKFLYISVLFLVAQFFISCKIVQSVSDSIAGDQTHAVPVLEGAWSILGGPQSDGSFFLSKIDSLDHDIEAISFKMDGKLTKRQNIGRCGTPPITYGNYEGTWKPLSDSSVRVRYRYWQGEIEEDWLITGLNENVVACKRLERRVINSTY